MSAPDQGESAMRDAEVPTFSTVQELGAYIDGLMKRQHDYGTCVYAMSMAAVAAFNLVAKNLGVTGFQASCADLDILRRTRSIKGPAAFFDISQALYPQHDLIGRLEKAIEEAGPWLSEQAKARLEEERGQPVHPDVEAHWRKLAARSADPLA